MLGLGLGLWQFQRGDDVSLISQSGVAGTALTGGTGETLLDTITIPAGLIGLNGRVNLWISGIHTGAVGTKTWRLKIGGTTLATVVMATTSGSVFDLLGVIYNVNSQSVQRARFLTNRNSDGLITSVAEGAAAIDTSAATTITLTGQLSNAADSMQRTAYYFDLVR